MALPRKLKHLNLFLDGSNWIGVAEDYTPAKLSQKFEAYRGGGMMGAANIHMGLDDGALDTSFTFGGLEADLLKRMGLAKIDGVQLRFAGSFQRDDTGEVVPVEIVQRGRFKENDRGTFKSGDNSQSKISMVNTYYKETMNGVVLCEIDLINMIWIVDGVDLMAEHRKAIGL
ncbi:phage major tail tube protein [Aeromonas bestiarum]|uniref:Phage major tail tube protein n=1 Tax=Aeromonas bestiarum TaxID=105751 RepID=A0AAW7IDK1_9GAMM|nr:phage major tail tube protein [Aeromonas bestiarum]MDM5141522.1 phage major tail tube protein [Aeromonas bestiarum]